MFTYLKLNFKICSIPKLFYIIIFTIILLYITISIPSKYLHLSPSA